MNTRFFLVFFLLIQLKIWAGKEDSLLNVINTSKEDTSIIKALNHLSWSIYSRGDYKNALKYSKEAIDRSKKNHLIVPLAKALSICGSIYSQMGNPAIALKYYRESLKIYETELKDAKGMSMLLFNIALVYITTSEFDKALECNFRAVALEKSQADSSELGRRYLNVGFTYYKMDEFDKAEYYTWAALRVNKHFKNLASTASTHNQLGLVYTAKKEFDNAFKEYDTALKLFTEANMTGRLPDVYVNVGNIYADKKEFRSAIPNYEKALKIYEEQNDIYNYTLCYYNLASVYSEMKETKKAREIFLECVKLGRENGIYDVLKEAHLELYKLYREAGDCENSFENYVQFINYKDTLAGEDIKQSILKTEMKHEYDLAQIADSVELSKERELVAVRFEQERSTRMFLYVGLGLVLLTTFFVFRNLVQSKRANKIITLQKLEVEGQKKLVEEKNILIEEKQREIIDSINYAKRIQNSIIASNAFLNKNLREYFVLFQPKDIVSGDFYWATSHENLFYLAVCDSTGHGVPGAFMSLLNIGFLSEAINEKNITEPNKIFDRVRERLITTISADGQQDGFDGVLVCFDQKTGKVTYAAAHNPPLLIREGKITELQKDKMPVGKSPRDNEPFSLYEIELKKGDSLYLYTDGYPDQFGGPHGKKFRYKQLEQLLVNNQSLSCAEQKELLEKTIRDWRGVLDQIDDILVFGIKV